MPKRNISMTFMGYSAKAKFDVSFEMLGADEAFLLEVLDQARATAVPFQQQALDAIRGPVSDGPVHSNPDHDEVW
jgi:hypothetical protein